MDIMNSKKTLLSLINGGVTLGAAPSGSSTVKFAYTENIAKVGTAPDGTVTFYADTTNNTGIIAVGDKIVSSKIFDVTSAAANSNKHGGKTITVTYFNASTKAAATTTFNVIDEAGLEAYFTGSKTIDISTGDIYEVKTDGKTILVDETNGLKTGLKIAYIAESGSTGATIALEDADSTVLSSIDVADIVGDGVLKDSIYHQDTNVLELRFGNGKVYNPNDPTTYTKVEVNLQKLIDINDVFIGTDSSIYLDATLDASTVTLNTKMQDPSTASANATGLADAWKVKQYVDSKSQDLAVEAESRDTYLDASVLAANNKKVWVAAQVADLTVAKDGTADTTITGTAGKLVDAADAATKTTSYVNARIAEEIDKLGNTADSSAEFVKVVVTTEDGDVSVVTVTEKVGSINGTTTALTGVSGLIDGAATAEAVTTYVEGKIAALDASLATADLNAASGIYTKTTLKEVDGVVTEITVANQIAVTSETDYVKGSVDPNFEVTTNGLLTGTDASNLKKYIDDVAEKIKDEVSSIDSSKSDADGANFISIHEEQEDGEITVFTVDSSYGAYNYTAGTHTFGTATDGLAKVADTQTFVQTVVESLDLANDVADASASDASNFVKTTISETDGIVKNESVKVTYAAVTAAPGSITVNTNGIVKGDVLKNSIESALTWTVLE